MKKMKILTLAVLVILLQNCQQTEQVTKPNLSVNQLADVLKTDSYLDYEKLISLAVDYSSELELNYHGLSKDQLFIINSTISKYPTPEMLIKNASQEEIKLISVIAPGQSPEKEFIVLRDKLSSKYTYDRKDLVNLISEKIKNQTVNSTSRVACGDQRCQHEAMAAYFFYLSDGIGSSDYAHVFMYGVYYHCRISACN